MGIKKSVHFSVAPARESTILYESVCLNFVCLFAFTLVSEHLLISSFLISVHVRFIETLFIFNL